MLSWLRGLSYLRLFQSTRVLIRLIVEVVKDMVPFMIVLIGSLFGFTITYLSLEGGDLSDSFVYNYRLMYGDFEIPEGTVPTSYWVLFVASSVVMPLIMLNMLIAIMSDTYSRVMAEIVPSDYFEIN